jgi:hypothetical protein
VPTVTPQIEQGYRILTLLLEKLSIEEIKLLAYMDCPVDDFVFATNLDAVKSAIEHDGL